MLNRVCMMGRLCGDPELKSTQSGTSVCTVTFAVERDIKQNGERLSDFLDVVAWGATAEFLCKYFKKGQLAVVSGRLQSRNWEDRQGNRRKTVEVIADNIYFAEKKQEVRQKEPEFTEIEAEEELPF